MHASQSTWKAGPSVVVLASPHMFVVPSRSSRVDPPLPRALQVSNLELRHRPSHHRPHQADLTVVTGVSCDIVDLLGVDRHRGRIRLLLRPNSCSCQGLLDSFFSFLPGCAIGVSSVSTPKIIGWHGWPATPIHHRHATYVFPAIKRVDTLSYLLVY
jgi:hypothetical protein